MNFHCKLVAGEANADLLLPTQENSSDNAEEKNPCMSRYNFRRKGASKEN
jgi:hypothetical protein